MSRTPRKRRPILRILFGTFCILLLAFLLYASQLLSSCYLHYKNAVTELNQIQDQLSSLPHQSEFLKIVEDLYRQDIQKAALLLSNQELSDETLADVTQNLYLASGMTIFQEDGTPLYNCGEATTDPLFLSKLRSSGSEKAANGILYRAIPFQDDLYLAISMITDLSDGVYQQEEYDMEAVSELAAGISGKLFIASKKNQRFLYGPDEIVGQNLNDLLTTSLDTTFPLHIIVADETLFLLILDEYEDYLMFSGIDILDLFQSQRTTITPALWGFGFLLFLLLAYTEFIRTDMGIGRLGKIHYVQLGKKHYLNTMLLRKLSGFALIGITCMICITYCVQLLIRSDEQRRSAEQRLDIAVRMLEEQQTTLAEIEELDIELLIDKSQEIRSMLSLNPNLRSETGLNSLARLYSLNDVYLITEDGKADVSNANLQDFMLSSNPADDTYPFWNVLNGFTESHVQLVRSDPYHQDADMMYVGINDSDNRGMIMLTLSYDSFKTLTVNQDTEIVLKAIGLDSQSQLLAVKANSTDCVFDSSNQYTGLSLDAYGLSSTFLRNGYSGTHQFDGQTCLITTRSILDWNLVYITPTLWISANSWLFTAMVIITGLLVAIIAVLPYLVVRTPGEDLRRPVHKESSVSHRSHVDAILTRDGQIELAENQVEQHTMSKRWSRMNASTKLTHLIRTLALMLCLGLLFSFLFGKYTGSYPLVEWILEQNWDKSLNVYALSYVVIILAAIWFVAKILRSITLFVTGTFSRRWKTLGILISNIIRYIALIASIFFTLQTFGVETSTLITSASALTLVFGLGCQSLVADMVAGVFLIFEGTFRVGDIITVDGWRGEVVEIGLRSTNVKNELGNVKVFQNSRISGAVNMTRDLTYAVCDIILPPGEPLEAFEEKLTNEFFPLARQNISAIRQMPTYEGVIAISGDSATLRISVKCLESEREQIRRDLYRELKLWREHR